MCGIHNKSMLRNGKYKRCDEFKHCDAVSIAICLFVLSTPCGYVVDKDDRNIQHDKLEPPNVHAFWYLPLFNILSTSTETKTVSLISIMTIIYHFLFCTNIATNLPSMTWSYLCLFWLAMCFAAFWCASRCVLWKNLVFGQISHTYLLPSDPTPCVRLWRLRLPTWLNVFWHPGKSHFTLLVNFWNSFPVTYLSRSALRFLLEGI